MKKNMAVVGKSVVKKDALDKALGKSLFAADIKMPGMLHAGVFRSSIVHGVIKKLDISKAQAIPGVAAVLTSKDVPGRNGVGMVFKDEPVLVEDKIRRYADAIALVAAETQDLVEEALEAIEIEYEEYEGVFSVEDAAKEDAPKIHGNTNIHLQRHLEHGNVDEAFKECDIIIENDCKRSRRCTRYTAAHRCIHITDAVFFGNLRHCPGAVRGNRAHIHNDASRFRIFKDARCTGHRILHNCGIRKRADDHIRDL